jgi:hypothetical protein
VVPADDKANFLRVNPPVEDADRSVFVPCDILISQHKGEILVFALHNAS